ncbi:MAG: protein phosphatase 2C domain-containing protein [Magnetococcales bacterium]|nr:protein phosphatase 2C domain-containing protein [Magnetococcales bacterium]
MMDSPLHHPLPPYGTLLGAWRTGAAHRRRQQPCQDAALWQWQETATGTHLLLAVADGHGGSHYDRSEQGARLAVVEGLRLLSEWLQAFSHPSQLLNSWRSDFARFLQRRWRAAVLQHHAQQANEEEPAAENPHDPEDPTAIVRRYGATLLVVLVQADRIYAGQIGDGKLLRIPQGGPPCEPLPADPALLGSETHSLCSEAVDKLWQSATWQRQDDETLLFCTDGLSDSFAGPEEFYRFAESLPLLLQERGSETIARHLPEWLDRYSEEGSGDDMTLLLLHPTLDAGV